jgi:hypothetical protein
LLRSKKFNQGKVGVTAVKQDLTARHFQSRYPFPALIIFRAQTHTNMPPRGRKARDDDDDDDDYAVASQQKVRVGARLG